MKKLITTISDRLNSEAPILWNEVWEKSSEIVLFGSWASGGNRPDSDIDLLCLDFPKRIKTARLDLVNYPATFMCSDSWLTSELANHIAHYGIWIKGEGSWRAKTRITENTLYKKQEQVLIRMARLMCTLRAASASTRAKELRRLRRDIQRLFLLTNKKPTPSSSLLDEVWKNDPQQRLDSVVILKKLAYSSDLDSLIASLI